MADDLVFSNDDPPHLSGDWTGPLREEEDRLRRTETRRIWAGALVGLGLGVVTAVILLATIPTIGYWWLAVALVGGPAAGAVGGLLFNVRWRVPDEWPRRPSDAA